MPTHAAPPQPTKKSRTGLVIGLTLGLFVLAAIGFVTFSLFVFNYQNNLVNEAVPATARIGECYRVGTAVPVDCETAHEFEVFSSAVYPAGAERPTGVLAGGGNTFCDAEFATYTGQTSVLGDLAYAERYPDEQAWNDGDRDVLCVIFDIENRPLTGPAGSWG